LGMNSKEGEREKPHLVRKRSHIRDRKKRKKSTRKIFIGNEEGGLTREGVGKFNDAKRSSERKGQEAKQKT